MSVYTVSSSEASSLRGRDSLECYSTATTHIPEEAQQQRQPSSSSSQQGLQQQQQAQQQQAHNTRHESALSAIRRVTDNFDERRAALNSRIHAMARYRALVQSARPAAPRDSLSDPEVSDDSDVENDHAAGRMATASTQHHDDARHSASRPRAASPATPPAAAAATDDATASPATPAPSERAFVLPVLDEPISPPSNPHRDDVRPDYEPITRRTLRRQSTDTTAMHVGSSGSSSNGHHTTVAAHAQQQPHRNATANASDSGNNEHTDAAAAPHAGGDGGGRGGADEVAHAHDADAGNDNDGDAVPLTGGKMAFWVRPSTATYAMTASIAAKRRDSAYARMSSSTSSSLTASNNNNNSGSATTTAATAAAVVGVTARALHDNVEKDTATMTAAGAAVTAVAGPHRHHHPTAHARDVAAADSSDDADEAEVTRRTYGGVALDTRRPFTTLFSTNHAAGARRSAAAAAGGSSSSSGVTANNDTTMATASASAVVPPACLSGRRTYCATFTRTTAVATTTATAAATTDDGDEQARARQRAVAPPQSARGLRHHRDSNNLANYTQKHTQKMQQQQQQTSSQPLLTLQRRGSVASAYSNTTPCNSARTSTTSGAVASNTVVHRGPVLRAVTLQTTPRRGSGAAATVTKAGASVRSVLQPSPSSARASVSSATSSVTSSLARPRERRVEAATARHALSSPQHVQQSASVVVRTRARLTTATAMSSPMTAVQPQRQRHGRVADTEGNDAAAAQASTTSDHHVDSVACRIAATASQQHGAAADNTNNDDVEVHSTTGDGVAAGASAVQPPSLSSSSSAAATVEEVLTLEDVQAVRRSTARLSGRHSGDKAHSVTRKQLCFDLDDVDDHVTRDDNNNNNKVRAVASTTSSRRATRTTTTTTRMRTRERDERNTDKSTKDSPHDHHHHHSNDDGDDDASAVRIVKTTPAKSRTRSLSSPSPARHDDSDVSAAAAVVVSKQPIAAVTHADNDSNSVTGRGSWQSRAATNEAVTAVLQGLVQQTRRMLPCYLCGDMHSVSTYRLHLDLCRDKTLALLRERGAPTAAAATAAITAMMQRTIPSATMHNSSNISSSNGATAPDTSELDAYALACYRCAKTLLVSCGKCAARLRVHDVKQHELLCGLEYYSNSRAAQRERLTASRIHDAAADDGEEGGNSGAL